MTTTRQARVARGNINRYDNSKLYTLYHAYTRPSTAKERAWNYCIELMEKYNGYGLKVLSYNTFMFTAAFLFTDPAQRGHHLIADIGHPPIDMQRAISVKILAVPLFREQPGYPEDVVDHMCLIHDSSPPVLRKTRLTCEVYHMFKRA